MNARVKPAHDKPRAIAVGWLKLLFAYAIVGQAGALSNGNGLKPKPNIDPRRIRRAVSGAVARGARPDRGLDRAADHGRRSRRPELSLLGGDGLSAHQHGRRPALWKIRRPLRPQDRAASGDRGVSRRLGAVRLRAEHGAADRLSRARRNRRRRADRHHHQTSRWRAALG
jgi:hypothetical protein